MFTKVLKIRFSKVWETKRLENEEKDESRAWILWWYKYMYLKCISNALIEWNGDGDIDRQTARWKDTYIPTHIHTYKDTSIDYR